MYVQLLSFTSNYQIELMYIAGRVLPEWAQEQGYLPNTIINWAITDAN